MRLLIEKRSIFSCRQGNSFYPMYRIFIDLEGIILYNTYDRPIIKSSLSRKLFKDYLISSLIFDGVMPKDVIELNFPRYTREELLKEAINNCFNGEKKERLIKAFLEIPKLTSH